jgi:hypothetical protein
VSEYRVVESREDAPRPFVVQVRKPTGEWAFARWAKSEAEGRRIIRGIEEVLAAQVRAVRR